MQASGIISLSISEPYFIVKSMEYFGWECTMALGRAEELERYAELSYKLL